MNLGDTPYLGHIGYWTCKIGTATPQSIEDLLPGWGTLFVKVFRGGYNVVHSFHTNVFYCFGGIIFTPVLIQVTLGFDLSLYYQPKTIEAFASVKCILLKVN